MKYLPKLGLISFFMASLLSAQERFEGLVEPIRDVLMGPPVAGRVMKIGVGEGELVKKGETLLSLDDRIEALEVQRRQLILDDRSELESALQRRNLSKEELASTRNLFETTASISRDELNRKQVEFSLSEVEVGRLEQSERREEAELAIAKARMQEYHIVAPFNGVLAELSVDVGESVQAGQPVLRLVDLSSAYLILNLPAEIVGSLSAGEKVTLMFDTETKDATISFISPVIDPASGLRKVKMLFKNQGYQVEPGRVGYWVFGGTE